MIPLLCSIANLLITRASPPGAASPTGGQERMTLFKVPVCAGVTQPSPNVCMCGPKPRRAASMDRVRLYYMFDRC